MHSARVITELIGESQSLSVQRTGLFDAALLLGEQAKVERRPDDRVCVAVSVPELQRQLEVLPRQLEVTRYLGSTREQKRDRTLEIRMMTRIARQRLALL